MEVNKPLGAKQFSDQQKYIKLSIVVDDGETTTVQTFYKTRDAICSTDYQDYHNSHGPERHEISFKAENDPERGYVSTMEEFKNDDGELYIRRDGILRKVGSY